MLHDKNTERENTKVTEIKRQQVVFLAGFSEISVSFAPLLRHNGIIHGNRRNGARVWRAGCGTWLVENYTIRGNKVRQTQ